MEIIIFISLVAIGLIVGSLLEKRHYRSIKERENKLKHILLFNEKLLPPEFAGHPIRLVTGSVVISSDYFKTVAANLKSIFGGRLTSYESLLDRGRREAILRMKEEANRQGAQAIFNVRLETSTLNQNVQKSIMCAEVLAYGTACGKQQTPMRTLQ